MNVIDRDRYDVSLMILSPKGAFMELLPKGLHLITNPVWDYINSGVSGLWLLLKNGYPLLAVGHFFRLVLSALGQKAKAGRLIAKLMPTLIEEYDTIVDFNGQQQLYYMIDKLKGNKKITFFHSDYEKWPYYYDVDKRYFPKANYIFTISEHCVESLKKYFPFQREKIRKMENISSLSLITKMAESEISDMVSEDSQMLLTIGHVCENKGILWAIESASILKKRNIKYKWFFIGSVDDPGRYDTLIRQHGVDDNMFFLGIKTNPYPYIRKADIIVHPSKFEGRSIALDEAKLLCKPVVVTNFSTVEDQFKKGHNATICEMNPLSIADAIEQLIKDDDLKLKYKNALFAERHDNSSEIEKLYSIFDE